MSYLILDNSFNNNINFDYTFNKVLVVSESKTFNNNIVKNEFSKLKFNYRDFIFYFQQMNKILYKPFNKYCYNFFLSFKKYNTTVEDKEYAHQFCFFSNFKLKNSISFYILDKLDNSFFINYQENTIFNFFVPCKGSKID